MPPHPSWWGPLVGFAFLPEEPDLVFAVSHEGVVAAWRMSDAAWTPMALLAR